VGEVSETPEQAAEQTPDVPRVDTRAELLPEEEAAGSADPEAQAAEILAESDERTDNPEGTREESVQTPDPEVGSGA
jgi:hypothetical protein